MIKLGNIAKDEISGFKGVVTGIIQYLNGCVRYQLSPQKLKDGAIQEAEWIDSQQVLFVSDGLNKRQKDTGGPGETPPKDKIPNF